MLLDQAAALLGSNFREKYEHLQQGDRIGRNFTYWAVVYLVHFCIFWGYILFSTVQNEYYFLQKSGWATFWAILL
jgi:hypothetical protein